MIRVEALSEFGQPRFRVYEWQRKLDDGGYGNSIYQVRDEQGDRHPGFFQLRAQAEDVARRLNQEFKNED